MKALVLAGGHDQIALIKELRKRGYTILLADYLSNPVAKPYSDKHFQISTLDIDIVKQTAIDERVDLVITACTDQAMVTMAKASEDLGLPCSLSYAKSLEVTNKSLMKNKMAGFGIQTSKYRISDSIENVTDADLRYPLVVKPVDANSSKGVQKALDRSQLFNAAQAAFEISRDGRIIIEEFIDGIELSVDAFIEGSEAKILSVSQTNKANNGLDFTIVQSYYDSSFVKYYSQLQKIVQQIADCFHLSNIPLLVQLLYNGTDFYVIEFSSRMGGGSKYYLIEQLSGVDIMKVYVDSDLGEKPAVNPNPASGTVTMNYVYCSPCTVCEIDGFERLKQSNIITEFFYYKSLSSTITKSQTSSDRIAGYCVKTSTPETMVQQLKYIQERLYVFDENHQNRIKHFE